jgi:hypothetical protein
MNKINFQDFNKNEKYLLSARQRRELRISNDQLFDEDI